MSPRISFGPVVLYLIACVGCDGLGRDAAIPISGRVIVDSAVWEGGGSVLFQSDITTETAVLGTQGEFAMRIPFGTYRVAVEPLGGIPLERPDPNQGGILPKYMMPSTSGITFHIDDENRDVVIHLDTR